MLYSAKEDIYSNFDFIILKKILAHSLEIKHNILQWDSRKRKKTSDRPANIKSMYVHERNEEDVDLKKAFTLQSSGSDRCSFNSDWISCTSRPRWWLEVACQYVWSRRCTDLPSLGFQVQSFLIRNGRSGWSIKYWGSMNQCSFIPTVLLKLWRELHACCSSRVFLSCWKQSYTEAHLPRNIFFFSNSLFLTLRRYINVY